MLKRVSIRLHLTLLSILLLTLCCIGLTIILNISANQMANTIEASILTPATKVPSNYFNHIEESIPEIVPVISGTNAQTARDNYHQQSILYTLLVVVVGGSLTYYISGKVLKPLQELNRQMRNCTIHNLSENLPIPKSHDEIAQLTHSFNEMSNKLDEAFAMQKRFSQSAAHELRTPLTVLKTNVDVFNKRTHHTKEEYDKLLSVITSHTNRLSNLVKDLLNLTNMEVLECNEPISIKAMIMDICQELSCLASEKQIVINIIGEEQIIRSNQSLLHRAFYNLVENGIKYNVNHGKLDIVISSCENQCVITLTDTGIGIPSEMRELIFEPFFRVDKSRSRQMGGSGLGLSTVKSILDKHNGHITITDGPNGGSTFKVILNTAP